MIKVPPEELRDLANKLINDANEVVSLAGNIASTFEAGTANFEGQTKNRYVEAFDEMRPIMDQKLPELLTDFAEQLKQTADAFEQLDG